MARLLCHDLWALTESCCLERGRGIYERGIVKGEPGGIRDDPSIYPIVGTVAAPSNFFDRPPHSPARRSASTAYFAVRSRPAAHSRHSGVVPCIEIVFSAVPVPSSVLSIRICRLVSA